MAFRGRGRGRGRFGGGGLGYGKQEPFVLFPDINLPDVKSIIGLEQKVNKGMTVEENLVYLSRKFQKIWKGSPFYFKPTTLKENQNPDVERFSDRTKAKTTIRRGSLFNILEIKGFPQELTGGTKPQQPCRKRVRWNSDSELQKMDLFEKLEQRQGQNDGDEKPKKKGEGEDEDEDQEEEEEEAEEDFSDDDYYQNRDFDDDEDEYNMDDDGDDEPLL